MTSSLYSYSKWLIFNSLSHGHTVKASLAVEYWVTLSASDYKLK